eukprot:g3305.t1
MAKILFQFQVLESFAFVHHDDAASMNTDPLLSRRARGGVPGGGGGRRRRRGPDHGHEDDEAVESLDYDDNDTFIRRRHIAETETEDKRGAKSALVSLQRYVLVLAIGAFTGVCAVFITWMTRLLNHLKFRVIADSLLARERAGEAPLGTAFCAVAALSCGFVFIAAALVVFVEPRGAGSGIPEIKCLLNGMKIKRVVRVKTLLAKAIGVLFSVSGGLPVGKEGPMIHSGSIIASGLSQGKSTTMGFDTSFARFSAFRNDKEKRDFIACGAAAGVAAAFGAPIGGTLFSIEEGASWWHPTLTALSFFCAVVSCFTVNVLLSGINEDGLPDASHQFGLLSARSGVFTFGDFDSSSSSSSYNLWEIPLFVFLGVMGGLLGALFNAINHKITLWRLRNRGKACRLGEALLVSVVMSGLAFWVPYLFGDRSCRDLPPPAEGVSGVTPVQFYCEDGQYDQLATLLFNPTEAAIKELLHFRDSGGGGSDTSRLSLSILVLVWGVYFPMACWTYGLPVPSGLFIPSLFSGALVGRVFGELVDLATGDDVHADAGNYALIGAAAALGGMARMVISLTVILVESTGDVQLTLPLVLTLMAARAVGNIFNEGLYDIHIHIQGLPILEWDPPSSPNYRLLEARHVMTPDPKVLRQVERAGRIFDLLRSSRHNSFPVVKRAFSYYDQGRHRGHADSGPQTPTGVSSDSFRSFVESESSDGASTTAPGGLDTSLLASAGGGSPGGLPVQLESPVRAAGGRVGGGGVDSSPDTAPSAPPPAAPAAALRRGSPSSAVYSSQRRLAGLILRKQLCTLLSDEYKSRVLRETRHCDERGREARGAAALAGSASRRGQPGVSWAAIEKNYPRYKTWQDIRLSAAERNMYIDLTPFMNRTPHTVAEHATAARTYRMFRTLGLRHLPVCDADLDVVGIVTRKDLTKHHVEERLRLLEQGASFATWTPTPAHRLQRARSR